eukprot:8567586-Pyramimonas_sp.AAC.1
MITLLIAPSVPEPHSTPYHALKLQKLQKLRAGMVIYYTWPARASTSPIGSRSGDMLSRLL